MMDAFEEYRRAFDEMAADPEVAAACWEVNEWGEEIR